MAPDTRTRIALYTIAGYQAIALTTLQFVLPVYVTDLAESPSYLTVNLALFSLPYMGGFFLAHLVGALIDVTGRVKPFVLLAILGHFLGLLAIFVTESPVAILAAAAFAGSFTGTLNTTLKTYVTRISEASKGVALSRLTMAAQLGWIVGGILTVVWLKDVGREAARGIVLVDLGLTVLALAVVWLLLPRLATVANLPLRKEAHARHGMWRGIRDDLAHVYAEPALVRACFATIFLVMGNWFFVATFSVYLKEHLGAPPDTIGWINVVSAIAALFMLPVIGAVCDRAGPGASIRLGAAGYAGCYVVMTLWPSVPSAAFVFSIPAYAAVLIGLTTAASDMGGVARRGGGIGVVDGLWAMAIAIGAAGGGLLADRDLALIPPAALAFCAVGMVLAWNASRGIDRRLAG